MSGGRVTRKGLTGMADALEGRRLPVILALERVAGTTEAGMRRSVLDALRDEWRRSVELTDARGRMPRGVLLAWRELEHDVAAAIATSSPEAWPQLVGQVIRSKVAAGR